MFYYFELRSYFYSRERSLLLTISINEIINLWNVTRRNVRYRLKILEELGYLQYNPGNGRGNNSIIHYINQFQQDVFDYVEISTKSESYGKIFELFDLPIPRDWIMTRICHSKKIQKEFKSVSRNTLKYNINLEGVSNLNPFLQWTQHETTILTYIGDTLFLYDGINNDIRPNIVHHYEPYDSYRKWIFHIRKGVKFHNNVELKVNDIIWSLKQYKKKQILISWILNSINKIKYISEYKFEIELDKPVYWLDRYLAWPNIIICQENTGLDNHIPVMSGAYNLLDANEDKIILESNKHYFKGQTLIDKIEIQNTYSYNRSGNITVKDSKTRNLQNKRVLHSGVCMLCFNFWKDSIIQNKYFREAVKYILDYDKMKKYFQDDIFEEATTFSSRNRKVLKKDRGDIANLLKKSGYKGEQLFIYCLSPIICGSSDANFVEYFDREARKFGVNLCMVIITKDDIISGESRSEADMFYGPDTPMSDYWTSFQALFHDISCIPSSFLSKDQLSFIHETLDINPIISSKTDLENKIELVENFIRSENLVIFLFHRYLRIDIDNQLREFKMNQLGHPSIKDMWIDE